jgi:hypothetical protein
MDLLERLIEDFRAESASRVFRNLDVLMDLEQLHDPRLVPFALQVVEDDREPLEVRPRLVSALRTCRNGHARSSISQVFSGLLTTRGPAEVRVAAALALADFTESTACQPHSARSRST